MKRNITISLVIASMLSLLLSGCESMKESFSGPSNTQEVQPTSRYLDFNDILIPGDLHKVDKETFITNGHGRLVLSGRVESESLSQYFINSMNTDGWTALNQYKFQGAIKLYFKKKERISSIVISENSLSTRVEIWVTLLGKI